MIWLKQNCFVYTVLKLLLAQLLLPVYAAAAGNETEPSGFPSIFSNQTIISSIKPIKLEDCNVPEDWEPPFNISKRFRIYLSGYEEDERPIWIVEIGTWDIRSVVEAGEDQVEALLKYGLQLCGALNKYSKSEKYPDGEGWAIFDAAGLDLRQFTHLPTVALVFQVGLRYRELLIRFVTGIVGINVNFPARLFFNLAKPFAGEAFERIELLGSNKEQWVPRLLQRFPKDQLPPSYGGSKSYKPVKVFG